MGILSSQWSRPMRLSRWSRTVSCATWQYGGFNHQQQQPFHPQHQDQHHGGLNDGGFQVNKQGFVGHGSGHGGDVGALHFDPGYGGGREFPHQYGRGHVRDRGRGRNTVGRGASSHHQGGRGHPQGHPGQASGRHRPRYCLWFHLLRRMSLM